ncbi:11-beta-hydroxysteroid dehydrogenase-like 5, partial [Linum perenne]
KFPFVHILHLSTKILSISLCFNKAESNLFLFVRNRKSKSTTMIMNLVNSAMNLFVPPASLVVMACAWPALCFINTCEWLYKSFHGEDMEDKVVIVTGASSGIGEQIAYEYAKRRANLVLVARRESRLRAISERARYLGAKNVMIVAADVVKEDDCRRFINQAVSYYGRLDHLVNTVSLGHTFYLEESADTSVFPHMMDINFWGNVYPTYVALPYLHQTNGRIVVNAAVDTWLPHPRMSIYAAAKAALINFYETLRFEVNDEIGVTIATHGWVGGSEMSTGGKFMLEEGSEMQWRDEGNGINGPLEEYARMIVSGACRGDHYVKYPRWYDIFLLYRYFAPGVLNWTLRQLLASHGARRVPTLMGVGTRPLLEGGGGGSGSSSASSSPRQFAASPPHQFAPSPPRQFGTSPVGFSPRSPGLMLRLE